MRAFPKVSGLMITGKCPERYLMAKIAADCFFNQIWPNKELVIINHGETPLTGKISQSTDCPVIEVMHKRGPQETLGDLRNLSKKHATGDWCIHWDDDDYCHRELIFFHMDRRSETVPTVLRSQLRWSPRHDCAKYSHLDNGQRHPCYFRDTSPDYPRKNTGEDAVFLSRYSKIQILENMPSLYVRVAHDFNVLKSADIIGKPACGVMEISEQDVKLLERIKAIYREEGLSM